MTLTIDLTPLEEAGLTAAARQEGLDPIALLKRYLGQLASAMVLPARPDVHHVESGESLAEEKRLLEEYRALVDLELEDQLSDAQTTRLLDVERLLDARDQQDPVELAMDRRSRETSDKLDEMLTLLKSMPKKA